MGERINITAWLQDSSFIELCWREDRGATGLTADRVSMGVDPSTSTCRSRRLLMHDKESKMSDKPKPMTQEDAARIQSHADKTGTNQDFKSRAQSAADKRANEDAKSSDADKGK
jgi:hypothetical protein